VKLFFQAILITSILFTLLEVITCNCENKRATFMKHTLLHAEVSHAPPTGQKVPFGAKQ